MALNSRLYDCQVYHERRSPKRHRFHNRLFMFYLDLDELAAVARACRLFSRERFNLYTFRDGDHLPDGSPLLLKERVLTHLQAQGATEPVQRVMLLTHLRVLGYVFNPVCFYLCFNAADEPVYCLAEVGNTFGELKLFQVPRSGADTTGFPHFHHRETKYYYVSPFSDLTLQFEFRLSAPGQALRVEIDAWSPDGPEGAPGEKIILSALSGASQPLTDARLLGLTLRYPLVTLQVILLIHWQAFRLWLKGVPFHRKEDHPQWQRRVMRPHRSLAASDSSLCSPAVRTPKGASSHGH